ncbi:MAG: S1C family serine protease [Oscillospiraceae bacterium]|nr:S1C family serine protease [Oscillospiraceae bacterium]
MHQEFENNNFEENGYIPPPWSSENEHPERVVSDHVQDVPYVPVHSDDEIVSHIPESEPELPVQTTPYSTILQSRSVEVSQPVQPLQQQQQQQPELVQSDRYAASGMPEWSFRKRTEPYSPESTGAGWREPPYREANYRTTSDNIANMYSPGINGSRYHQSNSPYNRRGENSASDSALPAKTGKVGRFFRAMCLVVVCALVSAAATYAVMEYRTRAGYHTVVNQVVLGGGLAASNETRPTPSAPIETTMAPEYIYDMALTQVVGIEVEIPTIGFFGTSGTSTAAGSGFIISTDGYILTNHHVIEPALAHGLPISVIKHDGSEYLAEVIGYEEANDVALIKIEATGLNPVILGNSDNTRVGHTIFAVGNPFGNLVYTMTEGIVSALDREVTVEGTIINTFQFSAAVNSGNSGGPIYNANGEVIGIVTAKMVRAGVEGIGFAVPINDAIEIASGLIEYGYIVGRPLLGITGQTVTRALADYYDLVVGVFVRDINPGSAAERAGLRIGDVIVGLGDSAISGMDTLRLAMRPYRAGDTAQLRVWRDGLTIEMTIAFDEDFAAGQPGRSRSVIIDPELPE